MKSKIHTIPEIKTTLHLFLSDFSNDVFIKENIKTIKTTNVEKFKNIQNIIIISPYIIFSYLSSLTFLTPSNDYL